MRPWAIPFLSALGLTLLWLLAPGRSETAPKPGVVEISYMAPLGVSTDALADAMRVFERESRDAHAREPVRPVYRVIKGETASNDASGDPTRFLASMAGGEPPDVISFERFAVSEWAAREAFEPLDGYIARDEATHAPDAIHPPSPAARGVRGVAAVSWASEGATRFLPRPATRKRRGN